MCLVLHAQCAVAPWTDPPWADGEEVRGRLEAIDAALELAGSTSLRFPWHSYPYVADGEHFTPGGLAAFGADLADALRVVARRKSVCVVSDSTLGYHGRRGAERVERLLRSATGGRVRVDAVNGSGFVARSSTSQHFGARVRRSCAQTGFDAQVVVFVGGWNDVRDARASAGPASAAYTVRRCFRT